MARGTTSSNSSLRPEKLSPEEVQASSGLCTVSPCKRTPRYRRTRRAKLKWRCPRFHCGRSAAKDVGNPGKGLRVSRPVRFDCSLALPYSTSVPSTGTIVMSAARAGARRFPWLYDYPWAQASCGKYVPHPTRDSNKGCRRRGCRLLSRFYGMGVSSNSACSGENGSFRPEVERLAAPRAVEEHCAFTHISD